MPPVTFLLCAESGHFEAQTLLAIECLRRFGGRFSNCPVLVVTPRFGPTLVPATLRRFAELDARYVRRVGPSRHAWYPYTNKAYAAKVAEDEVTTEQVVWLDSDVLVVSPPEELELGPHEDVSICSVDKNVGSSGPLDPYETYWVKMSAAFGVSVEDLPWIRPLSGEAPTRFRLHSGVYSFRRGAGLGRAFAEDIGTMLSSGVGFSQSIPFPGDDVALAYSIIKLHLRYRMLPMSCNFEMTPASRLYEPDRVRTASVIHYHQTLTDRTQTGWFLKELTAHRPDIADWLKAKLPLEPRIGGPIRRVIRRTLREFRTLQARRVLSTSHIAVVD